jgi:hypothetical protein
MSRLASWITDGLYVRCYLSTAGDFIALGTESDYPFQPGGTPPGIPLNWNPQIGGTNANLADVNFTTTSVGVFSISQVTTTAPKPNVTYGIFMLVSPVVGSRYLVTFQVRTMQNKNPIGWYAKLINYNTSAQLNYVLDTSQSDWEDVAIWTDIIPSGMTALRIDVGAQLPATINPDGSNQTWGIQFTNVAVTRQDATYPPPTWREITCDCQSLQTRYGRDTKVARYDVGSFSLTALDNDGEYSYRPNHPFGLRPGRFMRATIGHVRTQFILPGTNGTYLTVPDDAPLQISGSIDIRARVFPTTGWGAGPPEQAIVSRYKTNGTRAFIFEITSTGYLKWFQSADGFSFTGYTATALAATGATWVRVVWNATNRHLNFYYAPESLQEPTVWTALGGFLTTTETRINPNNIGTLEIGSYSGGTAGPFNGRLSRVIIRNGISGPVVLDAGEGDISKPERPTQFECATGQTVTCVPDGPTVIQPLDINPIPLFFGIIDSIQNNFTLDGKATTTFTLTDTSALLANQNVPTAVTSEVYSGNRFNILLTAAGWHPTMRVVDVGQWVQQPILGNGRTISDELGLIADSEGGYFFADRAGNIVYHDRNWPNVDPYQMSVYADILAEQTTGTLPKIDPIPDAANKVTICANALEVEWSRDRIINILQLANAGGVARTFTDSVSQQKYGPYTYQRLDFLNSDSHQEYLTQRASDIMDGYTDAIQRVNGVTFKPRSSAVYTYMQNAFLNQLVRVRYEHPTEGWGYAVVNRIQAIEQTITINDWEVQFKLDAPISFNFWERSPSGKGWDQAVWDTDVWDG